MADEQENKNSADRKEPKIDLPETFDSWTVITGSMSKSNETESTTKSNENDNKLHENDPEPSTSGVESLMKDDIDSPSENHLENTDELSDGISIIDEDSDSLGRHTPLNIFSNEDYHSHHDIMYLSEKYNKSTLTNPNENFDTVDSRSRKTNLNFKNGISGFFIISVFFAVLAFLAKLKYPEWSETNSINERIIDLELQNNLLRAELDILSKELNYIRNKDNNHNKFHEKNHYKDKMDQDTKYRDRDTNFHEKANFEDKIDQGKKNLEHKVDQGKKNHEHKVDQGKKNHENKIKVWPGGGDIQETEIDKEGLKKHYSSLHDLLEVTPMKEEKEEKEEGFSERRFINADYDGWTYPEYVDAILKYFDYNIDYRGANIFSIDHSTYDRLVNLLQSRNIEVPTKSQYQKFVKNFREMKSGCVTKDEFVERLDAEEEAKKLKERKNSETEFQRHLRSLSMQELRDIFVNSPDPEVQVTAQLILREKISEVKYHYNVLYKRKKKKITKQSKQSKETTEFKEKETDTPKDKIHNNKNTKDRQSNENRESQEQPYDASKNRVDHNKNTKDRQSNENRESQEQPYDASKNRVDHNKNSKEIKQSKDKHEFQKKPYNASKNTVDHNKNSKEMRQSKQKREFKEKDYHGSNESIQKSKNENSNDKNIPKKDWHEKLMKERENIRKRKEDTDKRKKNWYSERGFAREQARAVYKYK